MKKAFLYLSLAVSLFSACKIFDDQELFYNTHIILDEKAEMSVIPSDGNVTNLYNPLWL